jgi:uncharacterized protein with GYD domain
MAKYLIRGRYTAEGARGLMKDGGSRRRAVVEELLKKNGGKLEAFYFAYGDADVYSIVDIPDTTTALAISLAINSAGAVSNEATVLITPEEMDQAAKKSISYRAPGQA